MKPVTAHIKYGGNMKRGNNEGSIFFLIRLEINGMHNIKLKKMGKLN